MSSVNRRSKCCSAVGVIFAIIYIVMSLTYSLVARLYVKTFYMSAHIAGLGFIQASVLVLHLCIPRSCIRKALICGTGKCSDYFLCFMAAIYALFNLGCAVGYTVLFRYTINYNYDALAAMVAAWINTLLTGCHFASKIDSACTKRRQWECKTDIATIGVENELFPVYTIGTYKSTSDSPLYTSSEMPYSSKGNCCSACMKGTCKCIYSFLYMLFHLVLIIFVFFSAYFPVSILFDYSRYRPTADMYTVQVGTHNPLALFLKCKGNGSETILIENGFMSFGMANWPFLVKELSPKYTVCVHDRRGIGWSESFEYDNIDNLMGLQYTVTNVEFTKALVEKAKVKTPFYYAGHSYGGHHVAYMALKHPQLVKGLIFLDSSGFGASTVNLASMIMELLSNFRPTGLLHFVVEHSKLVNMATNEDIKRFIDVSQFPVNLFDMLLASMLSGEYFVTYNRERPHILGKSFDDVTEEIGNKSIVKPVLVIDADSRSSWFPAERFPLYNQSTDYKLVSGASHSGLVLSNQYAPVTSKLIDEFITENS